MSHAKLGALVVAALAGLASCSSGAEEGEAAPTAWTEYNGTVAKYFDKLIARMSEPGWDSQVEIDPEYGRVVATDSAPAQSQDVLSDDTFACFESLPPTPVIDSADQYRDVYPVRVERQECIVARFQPDSPPSLQTFIEAAGLGGSSAWEPVSVLSLFGARSASESCPVDPDSWLR